MDDLDRLCADLGIDASRARQVLSAATPDSSLPWYAHAIIGLAGWVTAIVIILFGTTLLELLGFGILELELAVLGGMFLLAGILLLRVRQDGYRQQLAIALAAAGNAMIGIGIALEWQLWAAALVSVVIATGIAVTVPNRTLQFLSSLYAATLLAIWLVYDQVPWFLDIFAAGSLAGTLLMLYPPQRDLRPTALVLLLAMPLLSALVDIRVYHLLEAAPGGQVARLVGLGVFLWLTWLLWQRETTPAGRRQLAGFAAAAAFVSLAMPPGGAAALAIMMLAFVLGSRPLAMLGAVLQIHFLWRLYYDLQMTLLAKSLLLMTVGCTLLALWWLISHGRSTEVRS